MKSEIEVPDGWKLIELKDIAAKEKNSFKRGPFGSSLKKEIFVSDGYKVYEQKNAIYNDFNIGNYYITGEKYLDMKDFSIKKSDLIISCSGTLGKIAIVPENFREGIINQALLKISVDEENFSVKFVRYLLESDHAQHKLIDTARGAAIKNMASMKLIKTSKILVPPLVEQQKIADVLSKVDEQIQQTEEIIEKTEELKKGLMQKLLTKGIGHIRFKQTELGEIPKEWEIKRIIECCHINKESISSSTDGGYEINYIDIASIQYPGENPDKKQIKFKNAPSRARRKVYDNNILISTVRPYLRAFTFIEKAEHNLICSTGFGVLESKEKYHPRFIYQYILSNIFLNQVLKKLVGSNYPAINNDDLKNIKIAIPSNYNEQKQIASILTGVDDQIHDNKSQLENLKQLKKGLMQDLLTGRVRVTV